MANHKHLWNRKGYFYFRISVPAKLVSTFGCKELSCSLKTTNQYEAIYRALELERGIHYIFMKLNTGAQLKPEEVRVIVKAYFNEALRRLETQMEKAHTQAYILDRVKQSAIANLSGSDKDVLSDVDIGTFQERLDYLVPANHNFPKDDNGKRTGSNFQPYFFDGNPETVLSYVLDEYVSGSLDDFSPSYQAIKKGVQRAINELLSQHQRLMNFDDIHIRDEWFSDQKRVQISGEKVVSGHKISECFANYMEEHKDAPDKSNAKRRNSYELWIELFGDGSISGITKEKVWEYKEFLKRYPKNRQQKYGDLSLDQIKAKNLDKKECLSVKTINSTYLSTMRNFVAWLQRWKDYTETNPFSGIGLKDNVAADEKRDHFSKEQLIAIFSTPVFQGCRSHTCKGQYLEGNKIIRNAAYWLPLIGLFSGARLGELCQLYVKDIKQQDSIWYFDINRDEEDKSTKTASSVRKIPLHPTIIRLGFIEYVEHVKTTGNERIFYDVAKAGDGKYSTLFSKRFANFLKKFDIKTSKTSFHSFRHTFINTMRNETEVPEVIWESITGHTDKKASRAYGGKVSLKKQYEAIEKLNYPFLDDLLKQAPS